ncbi:hypothetical protein EHI8A_138020 [Entamoeba histolytica HM-1:IMSS-B]|uniref:TLDc domain-containing protein n=6 Tax=Entamoeba histolytica TaxID=5759 RepID=C4LX29_ENTH1|nr:hypothetical protein EHI_159470 [Entamoeba histolytica HM-1:IMSS]EMD47327.1 Hypothetical protein EHI5A_171320 [Entamoeba histolytica KU27]EMH73182.1 hypothetical protein EHI8A_138020 [Entamoeba histolytica HM-1:IMSS-B]EMS12583.1 hypothetical protein KM1_215010 [Entamoeba histolytica HM-3:IMSS]ENY65138.1 hypothetical protein EHI7A_127400 [Entamoeba histolytica HM-1:IMSS-A]GAT93282.1 hypothetical protein CL6EHI_159470 [Entamoeba histolytica]|eukprot:XP_653266.1 hypothetical protein EHI_159470 [Entamoeba histolytica HM-1:IMSS]
MGNQEGRSQCMAIKDIALGKCSPMYGRSGSLSPVDQSLKESPKEVFTPRLFKTPRLTSTEVQSKKRAFSLSRANQTAPSSPRKLKNIEVSYTPSSYKTENTFINITYLNYRKEDSRSRSKSHSLSNSKSVSRSTSPSFNKEREVIEIKEIKIKDYRIAKLRNWVGKSNYNIIYNSKVDGLTARDLNSHVCGKGNIAFIVLRNGGECFGCYHYDTISPSKSTNNKLFSSNRFFLFVFNEALNSTLKRKTEETIIVHPNNDPYFVFTVCSAFWILQDGTVSFHQLIKENYIIPDVVTNPFCCKSLMKKIPIDTLLAVQWY